MAQQTTSSHDLSHHRGVRQQLSPVEIAQTRGRQRPLTNFGTVLRRGAAGTMQTVQAQTSGYLPPAGAVVSAALSGAGSLLDAHGASAAAGASSISDVGGGSGSGSGLAGNSPGGVPGGLAGSGPLDQREVLATTDRMQKENQVFNLRFVQIQESFARDGRTYTAISNLMKAKNDTARNTLSNLR